VKLQLDTTIFFHKAQKRPYDLIREKFLELKRGADSLHASTYVKREYISALINDCCSFQAKLYSTGSYYQSVEWLSRYGNFHKRYKQRIDDIIAVFHINHNSVDFEGLNQIERDKKLAQALCDYLRILIPELYESFEEDLVLPLDDRTHCFFSNKEPLECGNVFNIEVKTPYSKCSSKYNCTLQKMLIGEKERALKLLEYLRRIDNNDERKTEELKTIQEFLEMFYEKGNMDVCYEICTQGIGDLIIGLETLPDRTFITTNYKESEILCPAILQNYNILRKENHQA